MRKWMIMMALLTVGGAWALEPGEAVPDVALPSTSGEAVRLTDYEGQWLVLYFYPRAFTPGCTAQSCSLRDEYADIRERGAAILGVSLDNPERQQEFKNEHSLPFDLLSDTEKALARAFDSLMTGGLMTARKTFLIDPDGRVAYRFDRPATSGHAGEVIAELDRLIAARP